MNNWTDIKLDDIIQIMKKSILTVFLLCGCLSMTACGIAPEIPELSEEDTQLVTEYAAGLMLKYDTKYSKKLLDDEALAEEEKAEAIQREKEATYKKAAEEYLAKKESAKKKDSAKDESDTSGNDGASVSSASATIDNIGAFYGLDAFAVDYTGYELCDSYPSSGEDMFMAMEATSGNQLLILKFNVTNVSSEDANFDMFYRSPNFNVSIDGGKNIHQQATLLLDDMAAYNGVIGAGASEEMVLVFEVDDTISQIGSMSLSAKSEQGKGQITLQ